jgi:putative spermidine/putrescine transport system permease protein
MEPVAADLIRGTRTRGVPAAGGVQTNTGQAPGGRNGEGRAGDGRPGDGLTASGLTNRASRFLLLPATLLVLFVFAIPVAWLLSRSVSDPDWGFENFRTMLQEPVYLGLMRNTVEIGVATTVLCVLLGYPVAHVMATCPRVTRLLTFVVLVPFWSSILVRTFAWMVLLQNNGVINRMLLWTGLVQQPVEMIFNRTGVLIGMVQVLLPFAIFPLYGSIRAIDPTLMPAAACMGATPMRAFLRVQLPLTLPGLTAGATLVFVLALGYFVTPALLGGRRDVVIARMIQMEIGQFGDWGVAAALSLVLLVATLSLLGLSRLLARHARPA